MRGFLRIVLFVVAGPYVGLLALAVLIGSYTLATTGSTRDFTFGPELVSPGVLIVAYTVGGLPALASGIVASLVARSLSGWRLWAWMALAGGLLSLAGAYVIVGGGPEMFGVSDVFPVLTMLTLTGAVASVVCAMLFDGLAALLGRRRA